MTLGLYNKPEASGLLDNTQPFTITFDGRIGGIIAKQVFLRNDDIEKWYKDITVVAVNTAGNNLVDGTRDGYFWKLAKSDRELTLDEWALISPGNTLSITDEIGTDSFGDLITFLSLWVLVVTPSDQSITTNKSILLRINTTEAAVDE